LFDGDHFSLWLIFIKGLKKLYDFFGKIHQIIQMAQMFVKDTALIEREIIMNQNISKTAYACRAIIS